MFPILYVIVEKIRPFLVPICFVFGWIFLISLGWTLFSGIRDAIARTKRMHEIPCCNCQYFTNDHHLKCTAQPTIANTEAAINCPDFCPIANPFAMVTKSNSGS